jgi:TonB-linked SusC/RagA family outer membrane protein
LAIFSAVFLARGQADISGKVTHAVTGEPLSGVNISVKNTLSGTSTDPDGRYSLSLPDNTNHLIFSYLGMVSREISVAGDSLLNVELQPDLLMMEGIVVTAIGIRREQKALGYSVQELPGKELRQVHHDNFLNSLSGKVAGVQVTSSSGSAGASSYITIRGATSIDGNNQPLFIVDGVPISNLSMYTYNDGVDMSNRAMDLSPDDIESISVLKGGAGSALYGIRAASGAIVITTRKGERIPGRNLTTVFHTALTFDKVSQLPELQDEYGQGLYGTWMSGFPLSWGPRLDTCSYSREPDDWQYPEFDVDGAIVSALDPSATGETVKAYDQYDVYQTAVSQQYALELSGGSDKASFLTSTSYNNSEGVVPGNRWKRFTLRITGDADLSGNFNLFAGATYIHSAGDRIQKGDNTSGLMLGLLRTPATFSNAAGYELEDGSQRNYRHGTGYDNPYWTIHKNKFLDDVDRIISFAGFNWLFTDWLRLSYRAGIDYFSWDWKNYFARGSAEHMNGLVWLNNYQQSDFNSDLMLKADRQFNKDWYAGVIFGHNMFETSSSELSGTGSGLDLPDFYNLKNAASLHSTEYATQVRRAALYGILDISFRNMLYLSLTGRNEWSTTLPAAENSFFYPSVSLSWVFTELEPFRESSILPFGKLRFSYARVANDAAPYKTNTSYTSYPISSYFASTGLSFPLLGKSGFTVSNTIGNENLKPERTTTWEIGTDLRWLDDRIALDLTYFNQVSKDLLLNVPLSGTTGYLYSYMNAGEMASYGVEVVLGLQAVRSASWQWDAILNYTLIRNEVKKLAPGVDAVVLGVNTSFMVAYEGYPYQSFFGYDWLKDEDGNLVINDDPESPNYGFPTGNYDTVVYVGNYRPDWILGWNNTVTWKNLSFSFLLDFKKGGMISNGTRGSLYYFGNHADQESREPGDLYVFEGVKQSDGSPNDIQVVKGENWYFNGEGSTFTGPGAPYVEDAGWIRLREITLNYEFEDIHLGNKVLQSLSVYLSGRNLWLHTRYSGIDPETSLAGSSNGQGMDYYNMPGTKGVTMGLRLAF